MFVVGGAMNLLVLVFSKFFTNTVIPEFDPVVMSNFGLLMIVVWGLAYISVAKTFVNTKWLIAVFAVEKLIYGCLWTNWLLTNNLTEVYQKDILAGLFFSIYGFNDWCFFVFFTFVFFKLWNSKRGID